MFAFLRLLLLFFIVIPMIRSVINAVVRAFRGTHAGPSAPTQRTGPEPAGQASASTLLHQDPVCGTYVAAGSSLRKICNGKVFHFCSDECRDRYTG
jgi:YHS domain-containing protein